MTVAFAVGPDAHPASRKVIAAAAAATGWLAAAALHGRFWSAFAGARRRQVGLGGLAAGVFLAMLATGVGAGGIQLAELAVLPPLGFAAAALARPGVQRQAAIVAGIGLAAAGPLAFLEPVQLGLELNIGSRDVAFWALVAAGCALVEAAGGEIAVTGEVGGPMHVRAVTGRAPS